MSKINQGAVNIKRCAECGEVKPLNQFTQSATYGEKIYFRKNCRDCHTQAQRLNYSRRKNRAFNAVVRWPVVGAQ